MLIAERWESDHEHHPFKEIILMDTCAHNPKCCASTNVETKRVILYDVRIAEVAKIVNIPIDLLRYYCLSHELGHLLYQNTSKSVDEEYFAHEYAVNDCKENVHARFLISYFDKLSEIKYE